MRVSLLFFIEILCSVAALAQCPIADFQLPVTACREENIYLENITTGAQAYSWDVCSGDLQFTPTANFVVSGSSFFRARVFRMVQSQNGLWYGFAIDQPNNILIRFDFGNSPDNTPTVVNLGNPGSILQNPLDIHFVQEDNNWFALVANTSGNNLIRLNFGNDLTSVPAATDLGTFGGSLQAAGGVYTIQENGNVYAFVSNGSSPQITTLSFGSSILNTPTSSIVSVPGSSGLRGLSFIKECDRWLGIVTSYNTSTLFYLDYQNGLNQPPVVNQLGIPGSSYSFPASIKLVNEGGEFFAFIQSAFPAHVYRIAFGESILDFTGTFTNLGNFGISSDNSAFELIGYNSSWRAFSIDLSGAIPGAGRLFRFNFPESCSTAIRTFDAQTPPSFAFSDEGSYRVTLRANDASGNLSYQSKIVSVASGISPDIDIATQNICAGHPIQFTSVNTSATIAEYHWEFGDTNTASVQNPLHTYSSASKYDVRLSVVGMNGCTNIRKDEIRIFNQPAADFLLPDAALICTNQNYQFVNTTVHDPGVNPVWEWSVNGVISSTVLNYETVFTDQTSQIIKLKTSIPGCATVMEKVIPAVTAGPAVNFSVNGLCQNAPIFFTNESTGSVDGYKWDFGDGQNFMSENAEHNYVAAGTYTVTLTLYGTSGCANTGTKSITIYTKPAANFSLALPPFSCSGSASQFTDLTPSPTDSNITSWSWTFGDTQNNTAAIKNPTHVYVTAGDYSVSLNVATNFGCTSEITKTVTIAQTPTVDFTNTALCLNQPATFTPTATTDIKAWLWGMQNLTYTTQSPVHAFTTSGNQTVTMAATGNNNCVKSVTKNLSVPVPVVIGFSANSTCAGKPAEFTETSLTGIDPAVSWNWDFAGQASANTSTATHIFPATGNFNVRLNSTRQSGCTYSSTRSIAISQAPVSQFSVSTESGGAPLAVGFVNTSSGATSWLWNFNDAAQTTSTEFSPAFTYTQLGTYQAELIARNNLGCTDSFVKSIFVVEPQINVAVTNLLLVANNDGALATVTFENRSNVVVVNPEIILDLAGKAKIKERVFGTFLPGQQSSKSISTKIVSDNLGYICAEISVAGDVNSFDNRACSNLTGELTVVPPYPNPASEEVILEWIRGQRNQVEVRLYNAQGQVVLNKVHSNLSAGLNQLLIKVDALLPGLYFATVSDGDKTASYRVQVNR